MKTGYERWREWIDLARAVGEFDGAWITVELLHLIELRRHEILAASDQAAANALFDEIFGCCDFWGPEMRLEDEFRDLLPSDPPLPTHEPESSVTDGIRSKNE